MGLVRLVADHDLRHPTTLTRNDPLRRRQHTRQDARGYQRADLGAKIRRIHGLVMCRSASAAGRAGEKESLDSDVAAHLGLDSG